MYDLGVCGRSTKRPVTRGERCHYTIFGCFFVLFLFRFFLVSFVGLLTSNRALCLFFFLDVFFRNGYTKIGVGKLMALLHGGKAAAAFCPPHLSLRSFCHLVLSSPRLFFLPYIGKQGYWGRDIITGGSSRFCFFFFHIYIVPWCFFLFSSPLVSGFFFRKVLDGYVCGISILKKKDVHRGGKRRTRKRYQLGSALVTVVFLVFVLLLFFFRPFAHYLRARMWN